MHSRSPRTQRRSQRATDPSAHRGRTVEDTRLYLAVVQHFVTRCCRVDASAAAEQSLSDALLLLRCAQARARLFCCRPPRSCPSPSRRCDESRPEASQRGSQRAAQEVPKVSRAEQRSRGQMRLTADETESCRRSGENSCAPGAALLRSSQPLTSALPSALPSAAVLCPRCTGKIARTRSGSPFPRRCLVTMKRSRSLVSCSSSSSVAQRHSDTN